MADASVARWLWWPGGLYLLWAQSQVCDEYLVPSVQACRDQLRIPDDVAGATLMALGCNGPKLLVNVVAVFVTHSPVGIGTIVGSDIFSLLVICGASMIAAPLPLELDISIIIRDVGFYALSILMLVLVLEGGSVTARGAMMLAGMFVVYGGTVAAWRRIKGLCTSKRKEQRRQQLEFARRQVESGICRRSDCEIELGPAPGRPPDRARSSPEPPVLVRGLWLRLQQQGDLGAMHWQSEAPAWRFVRLDGEHLRISSTEPSSTEGRQDVLGASQPFMSPEDDSEAILVHTLRMRDVRELSATEDSSLEVTCVSADTVVGPTMSAGLMHVTVRLFARDDAKRDAVLEALRDWGSPELEEVGEITEEEATNAAAQPSALREAFRLVALPTIFALAWTVPACSTPQTRRRWPLTFLAAMCWLGLTSYWLCIMAGEVHRGFGIDEGLLGLTLMAAGTSFPNCIASVILARRGQSSMAVANALGSNIQNVFLALGFPWLVKALLADGAAFAQESAGILAGVACMAGSLLLFVALLAAQRCRPSRGAGYVLVIAYVMFVVYAIFDANGVASIE